MNWLPLAVLVAAMFLALAGVRYVLKPSWHHCPRCGCFWRVGADKDDAAVCDEAECAACAAERRGAA